MRDALHSESARIHTTYAVYNSGTTRAATHVKGTDNLIVAVVDAKHVLSACGVQAVSGLPFEG
jgi:hypothetical protein